ncbi:MAG: hypothetical protein JRD05_12600 [Deltaproteobacteria bacterium]|nr:hypothetical protein [Deltaproteobacteria bacterium]
MTEPGEKLSTGPAVIMAFAFASLNLDLRGLRKEINTQTNSTRAIKPRPIQSFVRNDLLDGSISDSFVFVLSGINGISAYSFKVYNLPLSTYILKYDYV